MGRTWLILDCNFLCYRAFYTRGDMTHEDVATGTVYGFFMDVMNLQTEFKSGNVIFCWDAGKGIRYDEYPAYKAKRKQKDKDETKEEKRAKKKFRIQVKKLRREILPALGIRNNFYQLGYESDDVMAQVCLTLPKGDRGVIISADKDMYQCLRPGITMYNPTANKAMSMRRFVNEYGIHPDHWATVKCLAGCNTDNVAGIPGVGEKKAIQYLLGQMNKKTATYKKIKEQEIGIILQNKRLVNLPHTGTKEFKVRRKHNYTKDKWRAVCKEYGFNSLSKLPFLQGTTDGQGKKENQKKKSNKKKRKKQRE